MYLTGNLSTSGCFVPQPDQGLCHWTPLGLNPQTPIYRFALRARHQWCSSKSQFITAPLSTRVYIFSSAWWGPYIYITLAKRGGFKCLTTPDLNSQSFTYKNNSYEWWVSVWFEHEPSTCISSWLLALSSLESVFYLSLLKTVDCFSIVSGCGRTCFSCALDCQWQRITRYAAVGLFAHWQTTVFYYAVGGL